MGIKKSVTQYMPKFQLSHFDNIQTWVGLRPVTPDGLPYIGRARGWDNLTVATGHAMMGLSLGPITGQLVAQVLEGTKPAIALDRLSPDRYAA
jgi:D-amino-acid dehydrogenase